MSFRAYDPPEQQQNDTIFVLVHGLDSDQTAFVNTETEKSMMLCLRSSFPRSRIIQYEYPNNSLSAFGHILSNMHPLPLKDRGTNFLQGLFPFVKDSDCSIHFIGHSMGGLVIKQCLWTASQSKDNRYKNIYDRTKSVAFYGTPHCGSYLADIYFSTGITTKAVDELRANNPFLIYLKANFNNMVKQKAMKILSIVEGQRFKGITKIVENASAVCGLGDDYEDVHILDYDHTNLPKPATIKDRRYTEYYNFITTQVYDAKKDLIRYQPNVDAMDVDDEDEKEGAVDETKIFCFDPDDDTSDDAFIAMQQLNQNENLENFSSVLSAMLRKDSLVCDVFSCCCCVQYSLCLFAELQRAENPKFIQK